MITTSWRIGHVRGVPVRLHFSLLLIFPLVAFTLSTRDLPALATLLGHDSAEMALPTPLWGIIMSGAIFAGVVLHELGHTLVARALGGRVRAITLIVLGGISEIEHDQATPTQQLWTALAGPVVSVLLAATSLFATLIPWLSLDVKLALALFFVVNFSLALFNLVPAYPLDGGRILRALLQSRYPPPDATRIAARVGQILAAVGFVWALVPPISVVLMLVAGLVYLSASVERSGVSMRASLARLRAREAMATRVASVEPGWPPAEVSRHMLAQQAECAIVRDMTRIHGVVLAHDLRRNAATVGELVDGEPVIVAPDWDMDHVLTLMSRSAQRGAIVIDSFNAIVGVVTQDALARALTARRAGARRNN